MLSSLCPWLQLQRCASSQWVVLNQTYCSLSARHEQEWPNCHKQDLCCFEFVGNHLRDNLFCIMIKTGERSCPSMTALVDHTQSTFYSLRAVCLLFMGAFGQMWWFSHAHKCSIVNLTHMFHSGVIGSFQFSSSETASGIWMSVFLGLPSFVTPCFLATWQLMVSRHYWRYMDTVGIY